jgi:hypothetical protein
MNEDKRIRIGVRVSQLEKGDVFRKPDTGEEFTITDRPFTHSHGNRGLPTDQGIKYLDPDRPVEVLFPLSLSERVLEVFEGDAGRAKRWLTTPNIALGDSTPQERARITDGLCEVLRILGAIMHGSIL